MSCKSRDSWNRGRCGKSSFFLLLNFSTFLLTTILRWKNEKSDHEPKHDNECAVHRNFCFEWPVQFQDGPVSTESVAGI